MTLYMSSAGYTHLQISSYDTEDSVIEISGAQGAAPVYVRPKTGGRFGCKTIFIRDLADPRVALNSPIPVTLEVSGNQTSVYSPDTGDFAVGDNEQAALDEFRSSMVDLYFMLKDEPHLGPLPTKHWQFLRSVIDER